MKGHLKKIRTVEQKTSTRDELGQIEGTARATKARQPTVIGTHRCNDTDKIEETIDRVCYSIHRELGPDKDALVEMACGSGQVPPSTNNTCKGVNAMGEKVTGLRIRARGTATATSTKSSIRAITN